MSRALRFLRTVGLAILGLFLILFGIVGITAALNHHSTTHPGEIVSREVQSVHTPGTTSYAQVPGVYVEVGSVRRIVESSPLYSVAGRQQLPIPVTVEEDSLGGFKRVKYQGTWYGAEAPVGVQIAFAVAALLLAAAIFWQLLRRRRRRNVAP